jgi:anti-sigma-K factor RskA
MSDEPPIPLDAADELLAIELAFALLDPGARRAAEARVRDDPAFATLFRRWQARALALLEGREAAPSPGVLPAIMRRLPANDAGTVRWWQAATGVAAAIALVLGGTLALRPGAPPPATPVVPAQPAIPPLVAVLASPERDALVAVSFDRRSRRVSALPRRLATDGREAQLWVIPQGGAPVSAGLIRPGDRTRITAEPRVAALMVPGATLAVSLEPRGGSRTGAPTGPVILTGTIARS